MSENNGLIRLSQTESQILYLYNIQRYKTRRIARKVKRNVLEVETIIEGFSILATGIRCCPYSSSCFMCPLNDCMIEDADAPETNFIFKR